MNEERETPKEAKLAGVIVATVVVACIAALVIAITVKAVQWILGL